jgi:hypothetical protein
VIVYISIGNSDDKLTQQDWAEFIARVDGMLRTTVRKTVQIHGHWFSAPDSVWQNCCWCIEIEGEESVDFLKGYLAGCCKIYNQDSVAWAVAPVTEFLSAKDLPLG